LPVAGAFVAAGWAWYTGAGACGLRTNQGDWKERKHGDEKR